MLLSLFRGVFGFAAACLAAALVEVAFIVTPADVASLALPAIGERFQGAGVLMLLAAAQAALFAAPFALAAAVLGERRAIRSPVYYAFGGLVVGAAGFLAQNRGWLDAHSLVRDYALYALLAAGLAGGLTYWVLAGRKAG